MVPRGGVKLRRHFKWLRCPTLSRGPIESQLRIFDSVSPVFAMGAMSALPPKADIAECDGDVR